MQAALAAASAAINRALALDPASQRRLVALNGRVLEIACSQPTASVFLTVVDGDVALWSAAGREADTVLAGSLSQLLALVSRISSPTALSDAGVSLRGDSQVVQQWQALLAQLDIDLEALVAKGVGDVAAHQLGRGVRAAGQWLTDSHRELDRLISEFLQYEVETVPTAHELSQFAREVDDLRLRLDRLEARFAHRSAANRS